MSTQVPLSATPQEELGRIKRRLTEKESIANARRLPRAPQVRIQNHLLLEINRSVWWRDLSSISC